MAHGTNMSAAGFRQWFYEELGMCACGNPEAIVELLENTLHVFRLRSAGEWRESDWDSPERREAWANSLEAQTALLGDQGGALPQVWLHLLNNAGLLEHGGGAWAGWITDRGLDFHDDLMRLLIAAGGAEELMEER